MRRAGNPEKGSTRARQREYSTAGNLGWVGTVETFAWKGRWRLHGRWYARVRPAPPTRPQGACPLSISPKGGERVLKRCSPAREWLGL